MNFTLHETCDANLLQCFIWKFQQACRGKVSGKALWNKIKRESITNLCMTRGGMTRIGAAAKIRPAVHALTARAPASLLWPISSPCSSNTLMPSRNSSLRVIPRLRTSAAATAQNGTILRAIPALQTIWRLKWVTHKLHLSSGNQGGGDHSAHQKYPMP